MNINFPKSVPRPFATPEILKNRGSVLELGIFFIIAALFLWFIVIPKRAQVAAGKAEVQTLTQKSNELADQQKKLENLVNQLSQSSAEIGVLDESLPLHPRNTWLYLLVENLANSSGMTVGNLAVANAEDGIVAGRTEIMGKPFSAPRTLKRSMINLGVTGTFSQFQAFLKKMEDSGRIMDIKSLDITASAGELLDFRLTLDAYYFAP